MYTQGKPELIAKAKREALEFYGMAGRGATASGAIVVRELAHNDLHPFVVHFFNSQDGGYYYGDYCETQEEALSAFATKIGRYDRDGELHRAFRG